MSQLPQRQVTLTVTLLADSDERAREIVKEMVETDGSALGYEIVSITDVPAPESSPAP